MREPCASCDAATRVTRVDFAATKFCAECPFGFVPSRFTRIRGAMESQRRLRVYSCRRAPIASRNLTPEN